MSSAHYIKGPMDLGEIDPGKLRFVPPEPPPWIPCSERMPPRGADVLVIGPDGVAVAHALGNDTTFQGDYYTYEATHWMPLPEPPKA